MSVIRCANILTRETGFKTNANTNTKVSITIAIMSIYLQYTD